MKNIVIPDETEQIAKGIVNCIFNVHSNLGPGLLESVYELCLCQELKSSCLNFQKQKEIPIMYRGLRIDSGLRLDIVVEDRIILELKAVEDILPVHQAQLMTYLKLSNMHLGFLVNFNVPLIKDGIKRIIY
ncbi:MAG: GxxExxY protein [Victivallales bacterium]|jgi:GxxExxY protein